jgi:hypothetical protein
MISTRTGKSPPLHDKVQLDLAHLFRVGFKAS